MNLELCEVTDASAHGLDTLSPFCLKVQRALHAAGLPYTRRHGALPSSHKALNPTGQVPVLLVDGRPITDSTAILRWIVEQGGLEASPEAWLFEELADSGLNGFTVASRWADETNWPRMAAAVFGGMPAVLRWVVPGRVRAGVVKNLVARDIWRAGPDACWARFRTLLDHLDARARRGLLVRPQGERGGRRPVWAASEPALRHHAGAARGDRAPSAAARLARPGGHSDRCGLSQASRVNRKSQQRPPFASVVVRL
jgi:glutathione S-transferase